MCGVGGVEGKSIGFVELSLTSESGPPEEIHFLRRQGRLEAKTIST